MRMVGSKNGFDEDSGQGSDFRGKDKFKDYFYDLNIVSSFGSYCRTLAQMARSGKNGSIAEMKVARSP